MISNIKRKGNRNSIIERYIKGKNVLDIGCVDHDFEESMKSRGDDFLHAFISKKAKKCLGIDIEKKEIEKMNEYGYKCLHANAENFNLGKKFDVIVAGEIIEHLYNAGKFLESVKRHMNKESVFILTTPNPFFFKYILKAVIKGKPELRHDHTCIFDPQTLSYLMEKHGFEIIDIYWTNFSENKYKLSYWLSHFKYLNANFLIIAKLKGQYD
jgi:2-polyprenyl-3-methyl-5-hydroxy-6-metoxy-1,4-benzoquinol methylase